MEEDSDATHSIHFPTTFVLGIMNPNLMLCLVVTKFKEKNKESNN